MNKKIAGILGALATLGPFTAADAGPAPADDLRASSYAAGADSEGHRAAAGCGGGERPAGSILPSPPSRP
jgi:hypothetical protein